VVFGSDTPIDLLEFSGAYLEQCDDALGIDVEAIGNELVVGSEGSQTKADAI
jgi:hypothetical protein